MFILSQDDGSHGVFWKKCLVSIFTHNGSQMTASKNESKFFMVFITSIFIIKVRLCLQINVYSTYLSFYSISLGRN